MPVAPTYPGVYVEEIPSGVRTIVGVATSVTAFIGRTLRGPSNVATTINSFGDFERIFGGLWAESSLGYAVRDFYLNGGSQAVIVRLFHAELDNNNQPAKQFSQLAIDDLALRSAYEGAWGANLRGTIDPFVTQEVADRMGVQKSDLFNLTVTDSGPGGFSERFLNVTVVPSSRRIDKVLEAESRLLRWSGNWPQTANLPKLPKLAAAQSAQDTLAAEQKKLADLIKTNPNDPNIPAQKTTVENAQKSLDTALSELTDPVTKTEAALTAAKNAKPPDQNAINTAQTARDAAVKAMLDAVSNGKGLTQDDDFTPNQAQDDKKGLYALEQLFARDGLFNLLCIPPYSDTGDVETGLISDAAAYCEKRRAMLILDSPSTWIDKSIARDQFTDPNTDYVGTNSRNAALYFPRLRLPDPLNNNQVADFAACGAVAGIFARTDTQRGVWKAPAGLDATLVGVPQLSVPLTDDENGELNPLGINCLRAFPVAGRVVWGARTLRGADQLADEWKYIPVRRTALYIEESLYRGLKWVVFEPNDEPLWAQIRLNVGAFMHNLFVQGAFQGSTPRQAYLVKCDKETTTQNDINLGIVNIVVGFAPLKPAEFVIIKLQQLAGQIQV
jgi:uncharacterized protein